MTTTATSLKQFLHDYQQHHINRFNSPARVDYDPDWRSLCETGTADDQGQITWQITPQSHTSFDGLERALEVTLHPDIKTYYGQFWFPTLGATSSDGDLNLIGIWNLDDYDNLQRNIIGHALQQRKQKLPFTVFFATTLPESEYCLAIDNQSGEVVLEQAGSKVERIIANDLGHFLATLTPRFDT